MDYPLPPISVSTWGDQIGGVAISWPLGKRAKKAILRPSSNSVWNELFDCSHLRVRIEAFLDHDVRLESYLQTRDSSLTSCLDCPRFSNFEEEESALVFKRDWMRGNCFSLVLGLFGWASYSQGTVTSFQLFLCKILILIFKQDVVARNLHARKEGVSCLLRNWLRQWLFRWQWWTCLR